MAETTVPTYIYKIVPSSVPPPEPLPDRLPVSELDQKDGFLHMSTAKQVPRTLKAYFASDTEIYLLRIVYENVRIQVKWENNKQEQGEVGAEGFFPHIYNGLKLGKDEIESVRLFKRAEGVSWDDPNALATSDFWFQY